MEYEDDVVDESFVNPGAKLQNTNTANKQYKSKRLCNSEFNLEKQGIQAQKWESKKLIKREPLPKKSTKKSKTKRLDVLVISTHDLTKLKKLKNGRYTPNTTRLKMKQFKDKSIKMALNFNRLSPIPLST